VAASHSSTPQGYRPRHVGAVQEGEGKQELRPRSTEGLRLVGSRVPLLYLNNKVAQILLLLWKVQWAWLVHVLGAAGLGIVHLCLRLLRLHV